MPGTLKSERGRQRSRPRAAKTYAGRLGSTPAAPTPRVVAPGRPPWFAGARAAQPFNDPGAGMFSRHFKPVAIAFHETFADSGFSMAGAVAYSFVLSLFPFCIFLGALA